MDTIYQVLEKAIKTANRRYERELRIDRHTKRMFDDRKDEKRCTSIRLHLFIYHGDDVVFGVERTTPLAAGQKPDRAEAIADFDNLAAEALIALTSKGMENICKTKVEEGAEV